VAIKHPQQWVRKQFRQMGLSAANTGKRGLAEARFVAESGHAFVIPNTLTAGGAIHLVSDTRAALGMGRSIATEKDVKPVLSKGHLRFSVHAAERWALMRTQAAVSSVELEAALFTPGLIEYSTKHDSWLFITGRIKAVVKIPTGGEPTLVTVMWSREELFEKHPRPEMKK